MKRLLNSKTYTHFVKVFIASFASLAGLRKVSVSEATHRREQPDWY
mgnify:CR=1 FL=1